MTARRVLFTAQKNEGPFILEWVAYHKVIGFTDIIVVSNDCTDGSDDLLDKLETAGELIHIRQTVPDDIAPQNNAERVARKRGIFRDGDWIMWLDFDEYLNVSLVDGTVDSLIATYPDADAIGVAWRLMGDSGREWSGRQISSAYVRGSKRSLPANQTIKSLVKYSDKIERLDLHRPRFRDSVSRKDIRFVHSGRGEVPETFFQQAFGDGTEMSRLVGVRRKHVLGQVNHYLVRSLTLFEKKQERGSGFIAKEGSSPKDERRLKDEFYLRSNRNDVYEDSILRHAAATYRMQEKLELSLSDDRREAPLISEWWDDVPNFGDGLGPLIASGISGRSIAKPSTPTQRCLCSVGSIIGAVSTHRPVFWGSGALRNTPRKLRRMYATRSNPDFRAVRGRLTAELVSRAFGVAPPRVLGDPALLLPRVLPPSSDEQFQEEVFCPHFRHREKAVQYLGEEENVLVIDVADPPKDVVRAISSSKVCVSTSLHGLIVAQAYGVPWCWLRIEEPHTPGRDFEFEDFFSTLKDSPSVARLEHIDFLEKDVIHRACDAATLPELAISLDSLENAFPFDLIESRLGVGEF